MCWVLVQTPRQLPGSAGPYTVTRVRVQVGHGWCQPSEGTFMVNPRYSQILYLQIGLLAEIYS